MTRAPNSSSALGALRVTAGLSQQDAALSVGLTLGSYRLLEYGRQLPSLERARKLALVFGCDWVQILQASLWDSGRAHRRSTTTLQGWIRKGNNLA